MRRYTVVCPGRVNIIGEHVDHQNYPVFPCAIKQSIEVKVEQYTMEEDGDRWDEIPALQICHESEGYESTCFQNIGDIKIEPGQYKWYNYLIASYFGICEYIHFGRNLNNGHSIDRHMGLPKEFYEPRSAVDPASPVLKKFKLSVGGEGVPQAAGLSSSSALTCAGSIAWLVRPMEEDEIIRLTSKGCSAPTSELLLSMKEIAHVSAHGEGYSGTASGGMDQAAICLSQEGKALFINFNPLTSEPVALPQELAIVIANTGRAAPKAVSYAKMYNKRVFELKCACYIILKKHNITLPLNELLVTGLRDVLKMVNITEDQFLENDLDKCLKRGYYNKEEIMSEVDEETRSGLLERRCGIEVWNQNDDFHCYDRVRHVLTENKRVMECVELCRKYGGSSNTPEFVLKRIGELLNGSFESLHSDFDCGCPELLELVSICRHAGAYGSRLTGAGWGGCTVSLVHKDKVDTFIEEVKRKYFEPIITGRKTVSPPLEFMVDSMKDIDKVLFATTPAPAAQVMSLC